MELLSMVRTSGGYDLATMDTEDKYPRDDLAYNPSPKWLARG